MGSEATLQLMVGFSIGMALLLLAVLARGHRALAMPWPSWLAGAAMLSGLALTQFGHLELVSGAADGFPGRRYVVVVFLQSLGFYWLLLGVLRPDGAWHPLEWSIAVVVLALGWLLPPSWAIPVALTLGTAAAVHLCVLVHRLRALRRWFALELKVLAGFALMGLVVATSAVLALQGQGWTAYAWIYTALIALGFFIVGWLLLSVPDLMPKMREAVAVAYAQTTLGRVDREAKAARLRQLFEHEQVHRNEALSLATVAEMLDLSTHQLSELVNTEFGVGFSRFVRQYRVETARQMLIDEPRASVLSVGMAAGFSSQSTFYVAFREQVGEVPGEYRQRRLALARTPE